MTSIPALPDLSGTRVLVTGGSSGLGRAMAEALVAAGADVAVTSRSRERAEATATELGAAMGVGLDTRDEAQVAAAVDAVWERLGAIDLLVDNAGLGMRTVNPEFMHEPQGFWQVSPEGFRAVVDTNLTGYFLVARDVTRRMLDGDGGRIVVISMNHSTMNRRGFVPYGPSRAGAEALARVMAADLEGTSVRVNILLPGGATSTGMTADTALPEGMTLLDPSVMAEPIVWLASPAAAGVHDERIVATEFDSWVAAR